MIANPHTKGKFGLIFFGYFCHFSIQILKNRSIRLMKKKKKTNLEQTNKSKNKKEQKTCKELK